MVAEAEFWTAVTAGDSGAVASMVSAAPGLAALRRGGVSAILLAQYHHKPAVVAVLRPRVPPLDIFEASALGDAGRVRAVLDADPSLASAVAVDGFGPLGLACFFGHEPVVRLLLERGARVDTPSANGMKVMPLHSAAASRAVPIARLLLDRGAPVNARQGDGELGFTPLMEAAYNGQVEMVELLVTRGADRSLRDRDGNRAADHARARSHAALAERLERPAWS